MIPFAFQENSPIPIGEGCVMLPTDLKTKAELFAFLRHALSLPGYFGANWDALEECLADLSWSAQPKITLIHQDIPLKKKPLEQKTYLEILALAAQESVRLHVIFSSHDRAEIERLLSAT